MSGVDVTQPSQAKVNARDVSDEERTMYVAYEM